MHASSGNVLRIIGIATNKGVYIAQASDIESSWGSQGLSAYYFDGKKAAPTFDSQWCWVSKAPSRVEVKVHQPSINQRYELKDMSMASEKIPVSIPRDEAMYYEDGDWYWNDKYSMFASMYTYMEDKQPDTMQEVEFVYEQLVELSIDSIDAPPEFNYTVSKARRSDEQDTVLRNDSIRHQIIDKIITPSLLIHNKPCCLSSESLYKIIRQHLNENIDRSVAKVTSDYDFCYTVKKVIALASPVERMTEVLNSKGKSYKTKKYQRHFITHREVEIFEMTHTGCDHGRGYKGYTPLQPLSADNEYELKEKLDALLEGLVEMINEPLIDCPHCAGRGVILKEEK